VAVPEPDQTSTLTAEITLKLDKPLTGKPTAGTEIKWDGQPAAFTKEPFMLTMSVDQADIQGMATAPCTPAAAKKRASVPRSPPRRNNRSRTLEIRCGAKAPHPGSRVAASWSSRASG